MKQCKLCQEIKDITEFYVRSDRKNAVQHFCKSCSKIEKRAWQRLNKEKVNNHNIKWQKENKEHYSSYCKIKHKERYSNDVNYKIKHNLRTRLNSAIKNGQKTGSAVSDLGCSIEELKQHLESMFEPDMSWNNYGEWHIDHIKPLSKFDLTDCQEVKQACHYSNLQPLWAKDNLIKGDK